MLLMLLTVVRSDESLSWKCFRRDWRRDRSDVTDTSEFRNTVEVMPSARLIFSLPLSGEDSDFCETIDA